MTGARRSAGILPYRLGKDGVEVLIGHPGGPYWAGKDAGVWSVIKGEVDPGEDPRAAAVREFEEETSVALPPGVELLPLGSVRQRSGKVVVAWAVAMDVNADTVESNAFEMEWPPRSGRIQTFPEIDRVVWATEGEARQKLNPAQVALVDRLMSMVRGNDT